MTDNKDKKFVIKHVFPDVRNMKIASHYGETEKHFNIPWKIFVQKNQNFCHVYLKCLKSSESNPWLIGTQVNVKLTNSFNNKEDNFTISGEYSNRKLNDLQLKVNIPHSSFLLANGDLTVECHITINKIEGILFEKLRDFTDETMAKLSDVVLVVEDQKFYVNKMYLAAHSTYFESLLLGNFDESKQSEVELKDIISWDFQKFLEVIYGEPAIDEDNVDEILKLADMYDAKTGIKRCEEFFINKSKQELKARFTVAVKYNMDKLKKICISEMKTANDIDSVIPEDPNDMEPTVWKELLKLSISICNNKK